MHDLPDAGPLAGIRVLDMTSVVMGPLATMALADLGADVIKLEPPGGDVTRGIGPGNEHGFGSHFLHLNRNKRSIALDLKEPEARAAALRLIDTVDVLVYNVRPAAMARLGMDYETLRARNPGLIYAGLVGYSQRGRYAAQPAFDDSIQAASGFAHAMARHLDGEPRYAPVTVSDRAVGLYAFGVIAAALVGRGRDGHGCRVDVPMFETMTGLVLGEHLYGHSFDPPAGDFGYPRLLTDKRRPYRTRDGWICCTIYTDAHWRDFMGLIGQRERFEQDPRFAGIAARTANIGTLYAIVETALAERTTEEWIAALGEFGIPAIPVHSFESLSADAHLADIGYFVESSHPELGTVRQLSCASEWNGAPPAITRFPPALGEHGEEILREAGLEPDAIDRLLAPSGEAETADAR